MTPGPPQPPTVARRRDVERRAGSGARAELIGAAGRLFAEKGIDGVSLREITRAAHQRNTTALQYHFGDRAGLLRALVEKHMGPVAVRRSALLDGLGPGTERTLRGAASVLVEPLVAELTDDSGGPQFLQVAGELLHRARGTIDPGDPVGPVLHDHLETLERWSAACEDLMPPGSTGAPLHRRFAVVRFAHIEIGRRAAVGPPIDVALFASQLIDLVTGLLGAELSPDTLRLLADRQDRQAPGSPRT